MSADPTVDHDRSARPGTGTATANSSPHSDTSGPFGSTTAPKPAARSCVQPPNHHEVRRERLPHDARKRHGSIFVTLATPHDDLLPLRVDVLHPEVETFVQTEPGAVQQHRHRPRDAFQPSQDRPHFGAPEYYRQTLRDVAASDGAQFAQLLLQHVRIQKHQRRRRLILRRRTDPIVHG